MTPIPKDVLESGRFGELVVAGGRQGCRQLSGWDPSVSSRDKEKEEGGSVPR